MVGIYSKIKNGLNWLKGKAAKYVAPIVGTIGDFANSDLVQGAASFASPFLDTVVPGLGTGIKTGLSWMGKAGDVANGLAADYEKYGNDFGISDMIGNVARGKYNGKQQGVGAGINFAKRPDDLNSLIELKSLPSPGQRSYVEEIETVD